MTAPTSSVRFVLARAAVRATGVLHLCSQRDTGALNPVCAANPIRSAQIDMHTTVPADVALCGDCAGIAARQGGVSAWLGDAPAAILLDLPVDSVQVPVTHPRTDLGDLGGLTASIRVHGVVQPILVAATDTGHALIAGARRLEAARAAGLVTIPAIVTHTDPARTALTSLIENLHRTDLNPIELAHAYMAALEHVESKAELGRRLGISREAVSNTIRLLGLSVEDQARVASGELTAADGRAILADRNRSEVSPRLKPAPLADVAALIADALATRVAVTTTSKRTRIVLDVDHADLARVLQALGIEQEAAA